MSYKLITAATVEPVTLDEAKLQCRVDVTDADTQISALITAARELAERLVDRVYAQSTWELWLDAFPDGEIRIAKPPITAIESITYLDDAGDTQTLSSASYTLDDVMVPNWVFPVSGVSWPSTYDSANAVRVRFTAGAAPADVPAIVKLWILGHVAWWFNEPEKTGMTYTDNIAGEKWSWF